MQLLSAQLGASPGKSGPPYAAQGVAFGGTNEYLSNTSALTGLVNGKLGIFASHLKIDAAADGNTVVVAYGSNGRSILQKLNTNKYRFTMKDASANTRLQLETTSTVTSADDWHHLLIAWNMATAGTGRLYLNDVDDKNEVIYANFDLDNDNAGWYVGATSSGTFKWDGDMADLYFNLEEYLDFDVAVNRRKIITAAVAPVDLGATGAGPTGSDPKILLSGAVANWHTNKGDGGGFVENGTLTASATDP